MLETLFISRDLVKVLDFFLQHSNYEYPKKEIMVLTGVSRENCKDIWKVLEKLEIIKENKNSLYQLNLENKIVKQLDKLDNEISAFINERLAEESLKKEKKTKVEAKT